MATIAPKTKFGNREERQHWMNGIVCVDLV